MGNCKLIVLRIRMSTGVNLGSLSRMLWRELTSITVSFKGFMVLGKNLVGFLWASSPWPREVGTEMNLLYTTLLHLSLYNWASNSILPFLILEICSHSKTPQTFIYGTFPPPPLFPLLLQWFAFPLPLPEPLWKLFFSKCSFCHFTDLWCY